MQTINEVFAHFLEEHRQHRPDQFVLTEVNGSNAKFELDLSEDFIIYFDYFEDGTFNRITNLSLSCELSHAGSTMITAINETVLTIEHEGSKLTETVYDLQCFLERIVVIYESLEYSSDVNIEEVDLEDIMTFLEPHTKIGTTIIKYDINKKLIIEIDDKTRGIVHTIKRSAVTDEVVFCDEFGTSMIHRTRNVASVNTIPEIPEITKMYRLIFAVDDFII